MKRKASSIVLVGWCCLFALFFQHDTACYAASQVMQLEIFAHTAGEISRESSIKIQFTENLVELSELDQPLEESPVAFEPAIKGIAVWSDRQTLEFQPEERLPAGQVYTATVNLLDLAPAFEGREPFEFTFATMRQAFEITVDGLQVVSEEAPDILQLSGKVTTADSEPGANIVKFLTADQEGKRLPVQWTHSNDRREHTFVVNDVLRGEQRSQVLLQWDGAVLDVEKEGKRTITVPAIGPFEVLQARPVHEAEQYIEIHFSDPLQKDQDLQGLIRVEKQKLRFTINRSIIRVYSTSGWSNSVTISVEPGIRNALGYRLAQQRTFDIDFGALKPQVRFVGSGVILPTTQDLTIPIEAMNVNAVLVEARQIYETNVPQFFQVNTLDGERELHRVGRVVWKKVVDLNFQPEHKDQWIRYGLDVTPLVQNNPGGIYRLQVTFRRPHIVYDCKEPEGAKKNEEFNLSLENLTGEDESSYWDLWEDFYEGFDDYYDYYDYYESRWDPCHPAYYRNYYDHNVTIARNVLVSDIGLIAKIGSNNQVFVVATDLKTAQSLPGVELTLMDYQQQVHSMGRTDNEGMALLNSEQKPFLLVAKKGTQTGYLKLDDGLALSVSHFDVGGQAVTKGLKGFIYGERGVWRPGDPIYLTFILWDHASTLPKDHPVIFELRNPQGQLVNVMKTKEALNGFYTFQTSTAPDAPTGNWMARVRVGGATFEKVLKIEMVMPNRLKIGLDFGPETTSLSSGTISGELSARWLHGAIAKYLRSDINLVFTARQTAFPTYEEYVFDDPARTYHPEEQDIFEGELDEQGKVSFTADIQAQNISPGMLTAHFKTRVFEQGGAFSVDLFSLPYHPYDRYVGIRLPKGDKKRGMLLTDTPHTVRIAMLDTEGQPVLAGQVEIKLYKIDWRWWWQKDEEALNYITSSSYQPLKTGTVTLENGYGEWQFDVNYPEWGRYLVRACDLNGDHCTGKTVYIDWPGWAGRAQKDIPGGATVLSFTPDKETYTVGEEVTLSIPTGEQGRGLVTLESGSQVLHAEWIEPSGEETTQYVFKATSEMAPNIYAHVTFLQPHLQTANDLPIRMYGVSRIKVEDPVTQLQPQIEAPETFVPEETAEITISEAEGKAMTYTVAIVDEGLLDLTRFKTPDPWSYFYQQEALGVKTWDLFDWVAGAYGGTFEKLLAIGGGEATGKQGEQKAKRFPPMVRFIGPFELEAGQTATHQIDIPQYVGSVRVMVVAGQDGAFGSAEKAVFVRKPLMILGTLPRVLGPEEEVALPITVFAMDETVTNVTVNVTADGPLSVVGPSEKSLAFADPGDDVITFDLKTTPQIGIGSVVITAVSGAEQAKQTIELDVRLPAVGSVTDVVQTVLQKGGSWQQELIFPGIAGTNDVTLEVSRVPPIDLNKRLTYLIRYPHGCVEQTTSSVFPQLYLDKLLTLYPEEQDAIQNNIEAGIEKLQKYQKEDGGFVYWPGRGKADDWSSSYAGHFLVEAQKIGYMLPPGMLESWKQYQRRMAQLWEGDAERSELIQAYRLYTLALAGAPELGAMNRLREYPDLPTAARWRLAAAYLLAGQPEAAHQLVDDTDTFIAEYRELSNTYGSDLRDKAMVLEALCLMNRMEQAVPIAKEISETLSSSRWLSTQTTAYALIAMVHYVKMTGDSDQSGDIQCTFSWNHDEVKEHSSASALVQETLMAGESATGVIEMKNTGESVLYARIIMTGTPLPGNEKAAANGMKATVRYLTLDGLNLYPVELEQGTDFLVEVAVTNTGHQGIYREVALSHLFPSGWEIHNVRMDPTGQNNDIIYTSDESNYQDIRDDRVYTYFDLRQGESKTFRTLLNASYLGKFYLPMVSVEAMYDAAINARVPGQWVQVVSPGAGE